MKKTFLLFLISTSAVLLLSGCGGSSGDLDFSIRFQGTLTERSAQRNTGDMPVVGQVCIFGECGDTDENGQYNFRAFENFDGGDVLITVFVGPMTSETVINLAGNADEVSLDLSVDESGMNLEVESVEVTATK